MFTFLVKGWVRGFEKLAYKTHTKPFGIPYK